MLVIKNQFLNAHFTLFSLRQNIEKKIEIYNRRGKNRGASLPGDCYCPGYFTP
ncbi:hypothetical protein MTBBW1_2380011 [Desulfamplus magnetovallimortis]|uniref:Uncharacterized protein n=1 Tax=Desulfamplus magnetovallimortis TaxID=1246637 RepID=A0A1W1HDW8_9BACT|nr:hypothetical protein MTBBW1_2380011 [Desulfamplus magnetovallimortis]